ncbi:histidine phosphatase family protein [Weissella diestrammenae]|uniref:Histidine phosphatase family protein n=1 Tax=Weissella diestrammenae TaxID=1162633 RepID=A0A7G9T5S0_9LACO|nr:histidine phosphatase family protein [Weissella diestrammenae]MCM0582273.1 histidine phosphatase family protein [Weissella diestrammenae]QNN75445.1 histidine phosphatase family protein [Weissella diestrammenae]
MTRLYFIRHGKTEWNNDGRFQGANGDSPLLPESYHQIKQLGAHLKHVKFAHAWSSPLARARRTAENTLSLLDDQPALTLSSGLIEFSVGSWEGQMFADVQAKQPQQYDAWRNHPDQFDAKQVLGAETFEAVQLRFQHTVKQAIASYGGDDVNLIFFGHGMLLTIGMESLLQTPLSQIRARGGLGNTSTSILETKDNVNFTEIIRNDTSYLDVQADASNTI